VTLQDRVDAILAMQRLSQEEATLLGDPLMSPMAPHATAPGHGGINSTYSGFLTTGQRAFHKPFSGVHISAAHHYGQSPDDPCINEVAAWRLARALGPPWDSLVPPCVLRDLPPGGIGSLALGIQGLPHVPDPFVHGAAQVDSAAFWDCLIAQQDRHGGNYRWDSTEQELHLIDHGFCFALPGDLLNASVC